MPSVDLASSHHGPGPPDHKPTVGSVAAAVDMDFSTDCTDSSLLYLLDTSTGTSHNPSCNSEEVLALALRSVDKLLSVIQSTVVQSVSKIPSK